MQIVLTLRIWECSQGKLFEVGTAYSWIVAAPLAANGNTGNREIAKMKMNSPNRCFERFALRIPGPPGKLSKE
jgi:hypothetical protein